MSYNINYLTLKSADELDDNEKSFIVENIDKLNDEDKQNYASFLPSQDTATPEKIQEPVNSQVDEQKPEAVTFKTQDEIDKYFEEKYGNRLKSIEEKVAPPEVPQEVKYLDGTPESWDDIDKAIKKAQEDAVEKASKKLEEKEQEKARLEQARVEAIKTLQGQYSEIAKKDNLPDITTKEGQERFSQLVKFGSDHNKDDINQAYDLWSKIPKKFGGGYDDGNINLKVQKKAATLINGGTAAEPTPNKMSYAQFKHAKLSELIDKKLGLG